MKREILSALRSPVSGRELALEVYEGDDQRVEEGVLRDGDDWFPIIAGLPIFPSEALQPDLHDFAQRHGLAWNGQRADETGQSITNETFSDKWRTFTTYGLEDSHWEFLQGWYVKKLGLADPEALKAFYSQFGKILECGTGSGFNLKFMSESAPNGEVFGVDISDAARTSIENLRHTDNTTVINADLFHTPFPDDTFDFVIADGVLHHTPSTRGAVEALYRKVRPGGQFFFYVYRKMGPARYFVDQHIRDAFMKMTPEECYEACRPITELGRELSKLNAKITLERDIPVLGLPAGTHDVQRFFYYGFMKCFWNDAFDFETNNMVNYDWYHPHHAWQHSEEEVRGWLADLGVVDYQVNDANPNGISVLLRKPL